MGHTHLALHVASTRAGSARLSRSEHLHRLQSGSTVISAFQIGLVGVGNIKDAERADYSRAHRVGTHVASLTLVVRLIVLHLQVVLVDVTIAVEVLSLLGFAGEGRQSVGEHRSIVVAVGSVSVGSGDSGRLVDCSSATSESDETHIRDTALYQDHHDQDVQGGRSRTKPKPTHSHQGTQTSHSGTASTPRPMRSVVLRSTSLHELLAGTPAHTHTHALLIAVPAGGAVTALPLVAEAAGRLAVSAGLLTVSPLLTTTTVVTGLIPVLTALVSVATALIIVVTALVPVVTTLVSVVTALVSIVTALVVVTFLALLILAVVHW